MILVNAIYEHKAVTTQQLEQLALLLAPFATELSEKMWQVLGHSNDIHYAAWPSYDEAKILQSLITLPVQINGKVRAKIEVEADLSEEVVLEKAQQVANVQAQLEGKEIKKVIYVANKILNIVAA